MKIAVSSMLSSHIMSALFAARSQRTRGKQCGNSPETEGQGWSERREYSKLRVERGGVGA